jgi:glutaredoxin
MKVNTMTSRIFLSLTLFALTLMATVTAQAQVYKWVDADGKVTYSDVPPPKNVGKVETKSYSSSDSPSVALPFELSKAVKSMPVVLYTSPKCIPCDDGRNFLKQNGIPFSEKTVTTNADQEKLNSVSGGIQLPFLLIGRSKFTGFSFSDWRTSLSQAGYPESNMLPADYQFPAAQAAAPIVATPKATDAPATTPQPDGTQQNDPNAFKF